MYDGACVTRYEGRGGTSVRWGVLEWAGLEKGRGLLLLLILFGQSLFSDLGEESLQLLGVLLQLSKIKDQSGGGGVAYLLFLLLLLDGFLLLLLLQLLQHLLLLGDGSHGEMDDLRRITNGIRHVHLNIHHLESTLAFPNPG